MPELARSESYHLAPDANRRDANRRDTNWTVDKAGELEVLTEGLPDGSMAGATLRWVEVATLDELWDSDLIEVHVGDEPILLAYLEGVGLRAYQAVCPHQERPLADGDLIDGVLRSSAHGWEFDLRTGDGVSPEHCRLYRYEVRCDEDRVSVGIPPDGIRHLNRRRGS